MQSASGSELHGLAINEMNNGDLAAALAFAQQAIAIDSTNVEYRETLARVHYRMGNLPLVISIYQDIVEKQPGNLAALKRLSRLLLESWQYEKADQVIARALAIDMMDAQLLSMQVYAKHELGHAEQARSVALWAADMFPAVLSLAVDARLLLPMVYADAAAVSSHRQRYTAGMDKLYAGLDTWQANAEQVFALERSNFLLAYQGHDDLELQKRYSRFIGQLIKAAAPELKQALPLRFDGKRKLKIGFVGMWFHESTAGNYFERWITQLDPLKFDRYVYYTGQGEDQLTQRIEAGSEHFVRLQQGALASAQRILADELDVLIHPEVGMSTGSYLLAAMRLAPLQFAAWGHPVTTGSEEVDYFLSCRGMEPEDHATHYSEKVILLDGIGVDIACAEVARSIERSAVRLPADRHLYFCPQSLFKIHPDMDEVFVKILQADSRAVLVFFQSGSRTITMTFADRLGVRLQAAGIDARSQIKFLPRLNGNLFRSTLALADVMLDTLHWSGGGTSLDAFAANVPVVTLPGAFMRGRQTAAMLRFMGLDDLITADIDAYVAKAVEVASNRGLNDSVRETIAAKKSMVFGRGDANAGFADAIYSVALAQAT